ncbi:recombinase family protein [Vibrio fluvialis]|nr:recombinase family protein [Vibrio fluvialis]
MPTAYSYIRFSSEKQKLGQSLQRQTERAKEYAQANGLTLSEMTFQDLGISAFTGANKQGDAGLAKFLEACEQGRIEQGATLIIESLDRLSREEIDIALDQLRAITRYVNVFSITDNRLYTAKMQLTDYIVALVSMARANEESVVKSQRLRAMWANRRNNPDKVKKSKQRPFWLDLSDDQMSYVVDEEKSAIVQRIFEMRLKGIGSPTICKTLNHEGITSPHNKGWNTTAINQLLRSRKVLGEYRPKKLVDKKYEETGQVHTDYYPSAITEDLFYRVQVVLNQKASDLKLGLGVSTGSHNNILKHVGRCTCGSMLTITTKRSRYYFNCKASRKGLCDAKAFRLDLFYRFMYEHLALPKYLNSWMPSNKEDSKQIQLEIDKLNTMIVELESEMDFLVTRLNKPAIRDRYTELESNVEGMKETVHSLQAQLKGKSTQQLHFETVDSFYNLLEMAQQDNNELVAIEARNKIKAILDTFDSVVIEYRDKVGRIVLNDEEFQTPFYPMAILPYDNEPVWFYQ